MIEVIKNRLNQFTKSRTMWEVGFLPTNFLIFQPIHVFIHQFVASNIECNSKYLR